MTRLDGADISHHQDDAGPIDWPTLRAATWWCATKATQSTGYVDPTFVAHWAQMAQQQFTHRLAYHWLDPTTSPTAQAVHFLQTVGVLGPGQGAMLDAEQAGITAAMVLEWCAAVEAATHRPCAVYTGAYVAGGTIWQSTAIRTSKYGQRPMHLAAYTSENVALGLPGVGAYPWSAWQYSSNGPVPGIVGRCDMNRIDNRAAYDLACSTITKGDDMATLLTNATTEKYGAGSFWVLMEDGSKRHVPTIEELACRQEGGTPTVRCATATLDNLPDWKPAAAPPPTNLMLNGTFIGKATS